MYEDPACRPLIFHSSGPNVGTLEPFPPANVPTRMQRTTPTRGGNSGARGATTAAGSGAAAESAEIHTNNNSNNDYHNYHYQRGGVLSM